MSAVGADGAEWQVAELRRYYERDYLTSPEGAMRLLAVVLCIALAVLLLLGACAGAGVGAGLGAGAELASAAALAGLSAARLLDLGLRAPMACFYTELVVCAAAGVLLLPAALLALAACAPRRAADYAHAVLGVATAALATGSAVATYVTVAWRWDARAPRPAPRAPPPDLDV